MDESDFLLKKVERVVTRGQLEMFVHAQEVARATPGVATPEAARWLDVSRLLLGATTDDLKGPDWGFPPVRANWATAVQREGRSVFGSLTVEENLTLGLARSNGRKEVAQGLERAYAMFPRLGERRAQHAGTLSGGEQRMLSLARVLVDPPRLLVVDELSLGLAPKIIDELYATLRQVNEAGTALLIVEQYVARAVSLAQSVVVLQHGEVVYDGSVADLGDATDRLLATHPHESN